jgi:cystathionine gamma-synthase
MKSRKHHLQTRLAVAGCRPDPVTGAITPPIHPATTYQRAADGSFPTGFHYTRDRNPTRSLLEEELADIEGAEECAAFSSGLAAASAVISATCAGGHLLLPDDVYHGVREQATTVWKPWGLQVSSADFSGDWESRVRPDTRVIWLETPSNPLARITDIQSVCSVARQMGILTVVDSTWTTPVLQRPLELGADFVLHSTTKYLGGHSDVLGGAILGRSADDTFQAIRAVQRLGGAVLDPFSCWLILRGMRSLTARIDVQCRTAGLLANFLHEHGRVRVVHYPGLPSHPGHEIARKQMSEFGAMLSFEIPGRRADALRLAARLSVFRRATSLGGTESLVEHRASIEPQPPASPEGLLRLSVGLEHPDDLLGDLERALDG